GSFEDLVELLEELRHDSPREPLAGMAFTVLPAQYLRLLQMDLPCDVGASDYSANILYYKSKTSFIHRHLVVVCLRLYYGRGVDRAKKTAEKLKHSAVSMWRMDKNGNIQT
ncbi:hypothetical protein B0T16DRAFT_298694, partial [Cercophora newfieldiana]